MGYGPAGAFDIHDLEEGATTCSVELAGASPSVMGNCSPVLHEGHPLAKLLDIICRMVMMKEDRSSGTNLVEKLKADNLHGNSWISWFLSIGLLIP